MDTNSDIDNLLKSLNRLLLKKYATLNNIDTQLNHSIEKFKNKLDNKLSVDNLDNVIKDMGIIIAEEDIIDLKKEFAIDGNQNIDYETLKNRILNPSSTSSSSATSNTGFKETLQHKLPTKNVLDIKTCPNILETGKKINNKYSIPSEFPFITGIKHLLLPEPKKGGKRRTKRNLKQVKLQKTKRIKKINIQP